MSTQTTNLDMTLNSGSDKFDIPTINENFTKIDDAVGELNKNLSNKLDGSQLENIIKSAVGQINIGKPAEGWFSISTNQGILYVRCTSDTSFSANKLIAYDKNYKAIWTL